MEMEKGSYSGFERFLFYAIPIVFTLLLTGVLLTVFGYDVVNQTLKAANKVPLLNTVIPDPKKEAGSEPKGSAAETEAEPQAEEQVAELQGKLTEKDQEINTLTAANSEKDETIKKLQADAEALKKQAEEKKQSDEEYRARIKSLAEMYAQMSPTKAGPILQNLTLAEQVLVLSEMGQDDRVELLEKMDPKKAAEASIALKDVSLAENQQIAALQERLDIQKTTASAQKSTGLTKEEVSRTFGDMTAKNAAAVLMEMNKTNSAKVVSILTAMDNAKRAAVLGAMADVSKEETAKIAEKLGN
ncbi:MotE family protein [Paenibacillus turpanensis]|uniref:MotE family protein n=1 Tax=Paenibacillus turpanensis TaxID=2689078 RepID=UPI001FB7FB97|nr:hypothetical protein [Paenibacillus turpanensis]